MRAWKPWIWLALAAAYYATVLAPLERRIEAVGNDGRTIEPSTRLLAATLTSRVSALRAELAGRTAEMSSRFGTTVLTGTEGVSLDSLLDAVHRSCADVGGVLRSALPLPAFQTEKLELAGLRCVIELPGESAFASFLKGLGRAGRAPGAMCHQCDLSRGPDSLRLEISLSLLRIFKPGPDSGGLLDAWGSICQARADPRPAWLVQAAPKVEPSGIPRIAPPVEPRAVRVVAAAKAPAPPVASFRGRLLGLSSSSENRDLAVLELDGQERVLAQGDRLDGWTLTELAPDHVQLKCAGTAQTLWFSEADRARPAGRQLASAVATPSPPVSPARIAPAISAPSPVGRAPMLGMRAQLEPVPSGRPCPAPFQEFRWVHSVEFVAQGGIADRAGIRAGDRLLALDDAPLRLTEQLVGLRARLSGGGRSVVTLERNGALIQAQLSR